MLYCIIADGEFDQVVETEQQACKEKADLIEIGCIVRIRKVASWEEANTLEEKISKGRF